MPKYNTDQDLVEVIMGLRKRIERLERAPRLVSASVALGSITISDEGELVIDGGVLRVLDDVGETSLYIGFQSGDMNRPDDTPQPVSLLYRDDGSYVLTVMDPAPLVGGYFQHWTMYDREQNAILGDDGVSGQGLARPYIPWHVRGKSQVETTTVTTPSWDTMYTLRSFKQHPKLHVAVEAVADASTTGNVRLYHTASSTVLAGPDAISSGATIAPTWLVDLPTPGVALHMELTEVQVQAQRVTGAGNISVRVFSAFGHET